MSVRIVQWVFIVLISKNMIICMLDTPSKDPGQPLDPLDPLAESSYIYRYHVSVSGVRVYSTTLIK